MRDCTDKRFLLVIETQKVKSYLFASPFMRETRGASVLLDLINRKRSAELLKDFPSDEYEEIYFGGGSGRVLFRNREAAETFRQTVIDAYLNEAGNVRVSVEIVERLMCDGRPESFAEWVREGVRRSQQNKLGHIVAVPSIGGRWITPCTSCGREPAQSTLSEHGMHSLCGTCFLKREEVREHLYKQVKPHENGSHPLKSSKDLALRYTDKFIFTTLAERNEDDGFAVYLPQDFEEIGSYSMPRNYMGFIYADGNRMGEVVKQLGTLFPDDAEAKQAYRAFSEIVDEATREAAVEAVLTWVDGEECNESGNKFRKIPAEFIMAGGDDLMLVVPAHNVMDVALSFLKAFQDKSKHLQNDYIDKGYLPKPPFAPLGLTTSAGVVIAHTHYPVRDLMTMAEELMKLAKNKAARIAESTTYDAENGQACGTLDFVVVTNHGSERIKNRRRSEYTQTTSTNIKVNLTERPYTVANGKELLTTIRGLKKSGVPRSKLKALYASLFQSPLQAQFDALRLKERLKAMGVMEQSPVLKKLITDLSIFPYRQRPDQTWSTPLTEIIELYDFVQPISEKSPQVTKRMGGEMND